LSPPLVADCSYSAPGDHSGDQAVALAASHACSLRLLADAAPDPQHPVGRGTTTTSDTVVPAVAIVDGHGANGDSAGLGAKIWGYVEGSAEIAASAAIGAAGFLYDQVTEHPLRTAAFVVGGVALVAAAPIAGALGAGAAVVDGIATVTYGALTLASADAIVTGGEQVVHGVGNSGDAMSTLTNPDSTAAQRDAARRTVAEQLGPGVADLGLGTLGGFSAGARASSAFSRLMAGTADDGTTIARLTRTGVPRGQPPPPPNDVPNPPPVQPPPAEPTPDIHQQPAPTQSPDLNQHSAPQPPEGQPQPRQTPDAQPVEGPPQSSPIPEVQPSEATGDRPPVTDEEIARRMARGEYPYTGMTDEQIEAHLDKLMNQPLQSFAGRQLPDSGVGADLWKMNEQQAGNNWAGESQLLAQARSWISQNLPKNLLDRNTAIDTRFPGGPTQYVDEGQYAIAPNGVALSTDNIQTCMAGVVTENGRTLLFHARDFDHFSAVQEAMQRAGIDPSKADITLLTGNRMTTTIENILPAFRGADGQIPTNIKVIPFAGKDPGAIVVQNGHIYLPPEAN
jgi:hypothetical protein